MTPEPPTEPSGLNQQQQVGCGFLWPPGLFSKQLEKTVAKVSGEDRQKFLDEVFSNFKDGKITSTPERYAEGMVRNGWMPSEGIQSSRRDNIINERIREIQAAAQSDSIVMVNDETVQIKDRFAVLGEATLPLGPMVARELDGKISITIEPKL